MPVLDGSDHTVFGRLVSGRETINQIEGMDSFKRAKLQAQNPGNPNIKPPETKVYIKNAGVYKFESKPNELRRKSAAGVYDFNPQEFYEARRNKWKLL